MALNFESKITANLVLAGVHVPKPLFSFKIWRKYTRGRNVLVVLFLFFRKNFLVEAQEVHKMGSHGRGEK